MRHIGVLAGTCLLALLLTAGCQSMGDPTPARASLTDSRWLARTIDDQPVADQVQSTIEFQGDTRVAGSTGCNRYTGSVTVTGDRIAFGPLASTRRACPPPMAEQEQRFTSTLQATAKWLVADGDLVLLDAGGQPRMRLAPLTASPPAKPQ